VIQPQAAEPQRYRRSVASGSENGIRERVHAFARDSELMEVITVAEDAVVKAHVDLEEAGDWLARGFS